MLTSYTLNYIKCCLPELKEEGQASILLLSKSAAGVRFPRRRRIEKHFFCPQIVSEDEAEDIFKTGVLYLLRLF